MLFVQYARASLELLRTLPGTMEVVSCRSLSIASLERLHCFVSVDANLITDTLFQHLMDGDTWVRT